MDIFLCLCSYTGKLDQRGRQVLFFWEGGCDILAHLKFGLCGPRELL